MMAGDFFWGELALVFAVLAGLLLWLFHELEEEKRGN